MKAKPNGSAGCLGPGAALPSPDFVTRGFFLMAPLEALTCAWLSDVSAGPQSWRMFKQGIREGFSEVVPLAEA